jgi:hypothetical protein
MQNFLAGILLVTLAVPALAGPGVTIDYSSVPAPERRRIRP